MKTFIGILFAVTVFLYANDAFAQKKNVTVNGSLVELTSYVRDKIVPNPGAATEIAMENLRKGSSLAIVESRTMKLYILAPVAGDTAFVASMSAYFGTPAFVKGTLYSRGGINLLVVSDIGKSIKK
jgi:hypothetical protein